MQDFKKLRVWQKSHEVRKMRTFLLRRLKTVNWKLVTDYLCGISQDMNSIII